MSIFGKKDEKNILHIDHLNPLMKRAIKTLIDSGIPEIAKLYGFRYLFPKVGEPLFIPYGLLDDDYKDTHEAFERILGIVEEKREQGMKIYKEWFPSAEEIDHYRFTFYSTAQEGKMRVGLAANPLASLEQDAFNLKDIESYIQGKKILILTPALAGQSVNRASPLSKSSKIELIDIISKRENEIIDSFIWLNKTFHERYDRDKDYDAELGRSYMKRLFSVIKKTISSKIVEKPGDVEVTILPLFIYPKNKLVGNVSVMEAWNSNSTYSEILRQGRFHEIEVGPILYNVESINELVEKYASNSEKLILITDQKTPPVDRIEQFTWAKRFRVEKDSDFFKVMTPAV
ncbi:hypothetical protein GWK48_01155 [Metallosphaera tengchongensis]|uniref:Uncharacterized protein n=1 Tax=Metallosphaera tengchongensis TaxID=1532350 RepID=A0A6N0NSV2_9CREN|nr:hypothetical protein [Metallosphaera tengchongensis]QKQ99186.1 hypothetical protein GWK48_01155 [Metallosphaera tengchongensis]